MDTGTAYMREDLLKLNELKCAVIACTMDLESIHKELYIVNHDYQTLKEIEEDLVYNVNFLKQTKITVVAQEYRRSIKELGFVRDKLQYLNRRYTDLLKEYVKLEAKQASLIVEYDEQLEICNNYRVVIPFDLSRRKKETDEK